MNANVFFNAVQININDLNSNIYYISIPNINNFGSFCERMNNFGSLQLLEPSWAPGPNQNGSSLTKSDHFGPSNLGSAEELGPNLIGSL